MNKVNRVITVALLSVLFGYFAHYIDGLIFVPVVVLGVFWAMSFVMGWIED